MNGIGPVCIRDVISALERRKEEDERRMKRLHSMWVNCRPSDEQWICELYSDYYLDITRINAYVSTLNDYLSVVGEDDER